MLFNVGDEGSSLFVLTSGELAGITREGDEVSNGDKSGFILNGVGPRPFSGTSRGAVIRYGFYSGYHLVAQNRIRNCVAQNRIRNCVARNRNPNYHSVSRIEKVAQT